MNPRQATMGDDLQHHKSQPMQTDTSPYFSNSNNQSLSNKNNTNYMNNSTNNSLDIVRHQSSMGNPLKPPSSLMMHAAPTPSPMIAINPAQIQPIYFIAAPQANNNPFLFNSLQTPHIFFYPALPGTSMVSPQPAAYLPIRSNNNSMLENYGNINNNVT